MSRKFFIVICATVLLLFGASLAFAQAEKGQISGQVTDPQGLVVPTATVEITNRDTSAKQQATVDENGHYAFTGLSAGRYQLVVQAQGFTTFTSADITLAANQSLPLDVKLVVIKKKPRSLLKAGAPGKSRPRMLRSRVPLPRPK
jgi:hypothetical protein